MLEAINDFLINLIHNVRVADILDVVLVSAFLFVLTTWLQQSTSRSTSRSLFVVASVFGVVYVLARFFEMYLMEVLIEAVAVILVLATIVAFQSDIRQMAERVGTWRLTTRPFSSSSSDSTIDLLTQAVAKMAESRTGALIAVKGRESWDHLIQGGIALDGAVSEALLQSLFNPGAPGHDGAVLLDGDRIVKFAAHLPLSTHMPEVSQSGGTRHTAALGLAEQSDALVIVVSEERGTISIAHRGQLTVLSSASALKGELQSFWERHYDPRIPTRPAWWRRGVTRAAVLSVVLAVLLWFLFAYRPDTVYRMFDVPIELQNLPPTWSLVEPTPSEVRVTLTGSELAFQNLDPSTLAISLDLTGVEEGPNEFVIGDDDLELPSGLQLYQVEPSTVQIRAQPLQPVRVPVQVQTTGTVPPSLELVSLQPTPDSVGVLVPKGLSTPPTAVPTHPIDLGAVTESSSVEVELDLPPKTQLPDGQSSTVSVYVRVRPRP